MDKKKIKDFPKKYPILFHLMLIIISFIIIMYGVLFAVDSFTGHGEYVIVPELKGKSLGEAELITRDLGFKCEVTDSTYNDSFERGAVVDQEPKANSKVKPRRTIYLTTNAIMPRKVAFPQVLDMSCRQGRAVLEGLGFKNIKIDTVSSPYKELIVGVKVEGKDAVPGERLVLASSIVLSIGNGLQDVQTDSLMNDSIFNVFAD